MNTLKDQLNRVPFLTVLNHIWIRTYKKWVGVYWLYDGKTKTDWWVLNEKENLVNDFSQDRPKWDVTSFLQQYLNKDFKEVLEWGQQAFNLINYDLQFSKKTNMKWFQNNLDNNTKKVAEDSTTQIDKLEIKQEYNTQIDVKVKFNSLPTLNDKQIAYLKQRWIEYEKVKDVVRDMDGAVAVAIYNEQWHPISINWRQIDSKTFRSLKGWTTKGVYMWKINKTDKEVFVVEWMFDFLSLYQFWVNVIGVYSCNSGRQVVEEFYNRGYNLKIIPDSDEVGKKWMQNNLDNIQYEWLDLSEFEVKDVNDLVKEWADFNRLKEAFKEYKQYGKPLDFEIEEANITIQRWINELHNLNQNDTISWWYNELDEKIWFIKPWELVIFGWTTWTWKTTFINQIAKNVSKQNKKVLKIILEDRNEDLFLKDLFFEINKIRKWKWKDPYNYNEFFTNQMKLKNSEYNTEINLAKKRLERENINIFTIKKNTYEQIDLDHLDKIIQEWIRRNVKLFVIDHLQEFKVEWERNEKLNKKISDMMYKIKGMAEYYKIVIFLVSHFRKTEWVPNENSFLDSIAISQVANKIIILHRDKLENWWETDIIIAKNREKWDWTWKITTKYTYRENAYSLTKSEYQIIKERIYYNNHPL